MALSWICVPPLVGGRGKVLVLVLVVAAALLSAGTTTVMAASAGTAVVETAVSCAANRRVPAKVATKLPATRNVFSIPVC